MGDAEEPAPAADADKEEPDEQCALAGQIRQAFGDEADDLLRADTLMGSHRVPPADAAAASRLLLPPCAPRGDARAAQAAVRLFDLIETIAQRSAYLAAEYPDTLARVARMVAASPWAAQYLTQHPLLLDSLIDWRTLFEPLDFGQIARQLAADLDACRLPDGDPDIERQMNLMRDVQRQASFQLLAQDLEGELTVEKLADQLSALADLLLAETIRRVWPLVNRQPGAEPRFAVIAYGKLGGKELGYASDLDLVFLFDDPRDDAAEVYAKLGRRMTSWLSTMTSSGRLYEIDLRLRPDGDAGLLAVSVEAFEQYQRKHAWSWEHQALTRARHAAGDAAVGDASSAFAPTSWCSRAIRRRCARRCWKCAARSMRPSQRHVQFRPEARRGRHGRRGIRHPISGAVPFGPPPGAGAQPGQYRPAAAGGRSRPDPDRPGPPATPTARCAGCSTDAAAGRGKGPRRVRPAAGRAGRARTLDHGAGLSRPGRAGRRPACANSS